MIHYHLCSLRLGTLLLGDLGPLHAKYLPQVLLIDLTPLKARVGGVLRILLPAPLLLKAYRKYGSLGRMQSQQWGAGLKDPRSFSPASPQTNSYGRVIKNTESKKDRCGFKS